jgi:uncharacterized protein (DUF2147 family)
MNRLIIVSLFWLAFTTLSFSQAEKVVGYWLTEEGDSQISIYKSSDGKYYGKVVWLKDDKEIEDTFNPDPALKKNKVLGLQILSSFSWSSDDYAWTGGTIYDPNNGSTYDCYMWFDKNYDTLKIKGYILGMRFLGRETEWKREYKIRL